MAYNVKSSHIDAPSVSQIIISYLYTWYTEDHTLTRVRRLHRTSLGQASGTREGRFGDSNLSSLRRTLQSVVAADAYQRWCTENKGDSECRRRAAVC